MSVLLFICFPVIARSLSVLNTSNKITRVRELMILGGLWGWEHLYRLCSGGMVSPRGMLLQGKDLR